MLLVLSTVTLAALFADYLASGPAQLGLANTGWSTGALVAVLGVGSARRRRTGRERSGWSLLLGACGLWLAGQLFWDLYSFTTFPASPNPADGCWLAFAAISAVAVYRLGTAAQSQRQVRLLALTPLILAAAALITALLWSDIDHSTLPETGQITAVAYPIFYVAAALEMLQAALSGVIDLRRNPGLATVLGGLALEAIAFSLWSPMLLDGSYAVGTHTVDALWGVGMILIGLGAYRSAPVAPMPDVARVSRRRGGLLPSAAFVILTGFRIAFVASDAPAGAEHVLTAGVTVIGATLIIRASIMRRQQDVLNDQLEDAHRRLTTESRRDSLTGLGNRLRLAEDSDELASRAERYGHGYSLVMIDLDHFKHFNDHHGHQAGDRALRQVAALLEGHARNGDRAYRYGGEELLLILPDQEPHAARAVAERHLANLRQVALPHPENQPSGILTFSAGIATARPGETPDQVLKRADKALYNAKSSGRNRVALLESEALPSAMSS